MSNKYEKQSISVAIDRSICRGSHIKHYNLESFDNITIGINLVVNLLKLLTNYFNTV